MFSCAKYPRLQEANITSQDVSRVDRQAVSPHTACPIIRNNEIFYTDLKYS